MNRWGLICLIALQGIGISAFAQTVPWIRIRASAYSYNDLTGTCSVSGVTLSAASIYFSAQLIDTRILRASFTTHPDWPTSPETFRELSPTELKSLVLYQDDKKRFWIMRVNFEGALVTWIMEKLHPTLACLSFMPSIQTMLPDPIGFEFELDAVKEGVYVSYSQEIRFEGDTRKSYPYEAKLKLKQERW